MLTDEQFANECIQRLNALIRNEDARAATEAVCGLRTRGYWPTLGEHRTIQVGQMGEFFEVGFLGILNGITGSDSRQWGYIGASYEKGKLIGFVRADAHRAPETPG